MTEPEEAVLRRLRTRAILLATLSAAVAFAIGWRSAVSLTIGAAVVIFSLLVLEKLTERLVPPRAKKGIRALLPLLLVTIASVLLLGAVVIRWRGFDPAAGAAGLSVVVAAVVLEALRGGEVKIR